MASDYGSARFKLTNKCPVCDQDKQYNEIVRLLAWMPEGSDLVCCRGCYLKGVRWFLEKAKEEYEREQKEAAGRDD